MAYDFTEISARGLSVLAAERQRSQIPSGMTQRFVARARSEGIRVESGNRLKDAEAESVCSFCRHRCDRCSSPDREFPHAWQAEALLYPRETTAPLIKPPWLLQVRTPSLPKFQILTCGSSLRRHEPN